ncbi:MAG: hypothetical protein WCR67_04085 [Bacilli bacterium]
MGNNLVSFFLPILSCLALTGTGFGVWVFNSTNASGETTHANYTVTSAASVNSLTAVLDSNNKEIILDENSTDMNVDVSVSSYIDFQRGMIGKYQISSYQYSSVTDLIKIAVDYQLVFSFEGNIGKYIEVKDVKLASNSQELTEKASAEKQTFIYTKN